MATTVEPSLVNIAAHLPAAARQRPYALAVAYPEGRNRRGRVCYSHMTYRQLDEESDVIARGLVDLGIGRGVRTVLMVKPSLEFFALTFALFKVGAVMIGVDPGMGIRNLGKCLREAEPEAFIGIRAAHVARRLLGWGRRTIRTKILVGPSRGLPTGAIRLDAVRRRGAALPEIQIAATTSDDVAAILFTSGSTGVPKGAVYTHAIFEAQVNELRTTYNIEPGEVDLTTFPLFALFAPALGMTAIVPEMDFTRPAHVDPRKIAEAIENFGVTNLFGSPALLNRVARWGEPRGVKFPSLRRVISAGAPMPASILEQFTSLLPADVQVFTPYGATESLPVASIGSNEVLSETRLLTDRGKGICVGRAVGGISIHIIRISDDAIAQWSDDLLVPPGEIGEIVVRGPVVTSEYYGRRQSTRMAKIASTDGGVYHRMGDVGYLDEQNRLWFCGRKSHRVRTPDATLFTIPAEAIFNTHPAVFRSALVSLQDETKAVEPGLCVQLEAEAMDKNQATIRRELLEIGANFSHTKAIQKIFFHKDFPVDRRHNAKIDREALATWAARQQS